MTGRPRPRGAGGSVGRAFLVVAVMALFLGAVPAVAAVGDLDPSFGGGLVLGPPIKEPAMAVQADQKIVVVGYREVNPSTIGTGRYDGVVARFNENGTPDTSFGVNGVVSADLDAPDTATVTSDERFADVVIQADGKIVAVGLAQRPGDRRKVLLARFNSNGTLDTSFGGGLVVEDFLGLDQVASAVVLQGDKVLVGGTVKPVVPVTVPPTVATTDFLLARYNADGSRDTTFDADGVVTTTIFGPPVNPTDSDDSLVDLLLDGSHIVAGGYTIKPSTPSTPRRWALARYDASTGALDTGSGFGGTDGKVTTVLRDGATLAALAAHAGKVVAVGSSVHAATGTNAITLARYDNLGNLDPGFGGGGTVVTNVGETSVGEAVAVDPTGALLVAGHTAADAELGDTDGVLVRYSAAGQPDVAFASGGVAVTDFGSSLDEAHALAVQSGKPLVAGTASPGGLILARYQTDDVPEGPADMAVSAMADRDVVTAGEEVAVALTLMNQGPDGASNAVVSGPLPAGGDILSVQLAPEQGVCSYDATAFTCTVRFLAAGAAAHVTLFLLARAEGVLNQQVTVASGADGVPANDAASVTVRVNAGDGRWDGAPALPSDARTGHTATLLTDGRVLVVGGSTSDAVTGAVTGLVSADLYDSATGTWAPAAPLPASGRSGHTATLLRDGRVLVAGGALGPRDDELTTATAVLYDPATNAWAQAPDMGRARARHTATQLADGRLLVTGGFVNEGVPPGACVSPVPMAAEVFDPTGGGGAGSWSATAPRLFATVEHTANLLPDNRVLVVGGFRGALYQATRNSPPDCPDPVGQVALAELFDPRTGAWSEAPSPAVARRAHIATSLADGRVLVAGGTPCGSGDCITTATEIYDPAGGRWTPARSMLTRRAYATAVLLPGGRVLVSGGQTPSVFALGRGEDSEENRITPVRASAEVFDPSSGRWIVAGAMATARQHHTATVLPLGPTSLCSDRCGRVLVAGGERDHDDPLRSADVYTPVPSLTGAVPAFGPPAGGTLVTIRGTGLAGATAVRFGAVPATSFVVESSTTITAVAPPQATGLVTISVTTPGGTSPAAGGPLFSYGLGGYWLVASDGGVFAFGDAAFRGSTGALRLSQPVVGMAAAPGARGGYWLVAADGGVFAFGGAPFRGSTGALRLNRPMVGMAPTPSGNGYWLVASDGGVFAFGDAVFRGSTGALRLNAPIVGMAPTPSGKGYWLVASDGGVFAFGDAAFRGSTGALRLNRPMVGMAPTPSGNGYWLVASDGGVFAFGDAVFRGSTGALRLNAPIVGMAPTPFGNGYWLVASDGGVFSFGDASFRGSTGALRLARPVVGIAATHP